MLTYQLHNLAAVVEVAATQPEFHQHKALLLQLQARLDLTANRLFKTERNLAARRERLKNK